jgi:histidinol dehydrogenase
MKRLSVAEFRRACPDPAGPGDQTAVSDIIAEVRRSGDSALKEFTRRFDGVEVGPLAVGADEFAAAARRTDADLIAAMGEAADAIQAFSRHQMRMFTGFEVEIRPGVFAGQAVVPLARAGAYVPGGRYPLVSTLLMTVIPASTAGVREIFICTPPGRDGGVPDPILTAAELCGVREVYRVGGAQAIAAMAYGTESIRRADKIVGPGNDFVTAAKRAVAGDVGIDFAAGPTELLILADRTADALFVAADLVAQAEHDVRATAMLITDSESLAARAEDEIERLLGMVRTAGVARAALGQRGGIVVVDSMEEALVLADERAPEHLELFGEGATRLAGRLRNYGSLFVGERSAEVLGDYSSGLNHVLPTGGAARYTGGLSVRDFLKLQTVLRVEDGGLSAIGPAAARLARAEGLDGHALAVELRMRR